MNLRSARLTLLCVGGVVLASCGGETSPGAADQDSGAADTAASLFPDVATDNRTAAGPDVQGDVRPDAGADTGTPDVADAPSALGSDGAVDPVAALAWPDRKYISVDEVYARVQANDQDMLLINVVDEQYYNLGFVPGSLKIPWNTLESRLGELDRTRHIVVYCRKGVRSETAYDTLIANGFTLVWVMEGSIERWIAAGYPTVAE